MDFKITTEIVALHSLIWLAAVLASIGLQPLSDTDPKGPKLYQKHKRLRWASPIGQSVIGVQVLTDCFIGLFRFPLEEAIFWGPVCLAAALFGVICIWAAIDGILELRTALKVQQISQQS